VVVAVFGRLLLSTPAPVALLLVFLLPALEASVFLGFVFPGETAVVLGGVLAAQHRFPVGLAAAAAALGAVLGDSAGYAIGRRFGEPLLARVPQRVLSTRQRRRVVEFLKRRGAFGVVIGRFTTVLRVLVPGVAGMVEMPYRRRFLPANLVGGVGWAVLYTGLGYLAGRHYATVLGKASLTSTLVLVGIIVVLLGLWAWHHLVVPLRDRAAE
jgi:membrane-associated protein